MNTIARIFFSGDVYGPKDFQMWTKKMWYEHVKRRPAIDKSYSLNYTYSAEELKIINTPIEKLMETFEKSLTN